MLFSTHFGTEICVISVRVLGYFSKFCHGLIFVSRVNFGKIVTGMCHGLLWPLKVSRVKRCVTGMFFENCHGLLQKCHGEKTLCSSGVSKH